jgi:hypothetical protein
MASVHMDIPIRADPSTAWEALCDFANVHERVATGFVTDSHLDDGDRVATFENSSGSRFVWTTDLLPDTARPVIEAMMEQGAVAIARTLRG